MGTLVTLHLPPDSPLADEPWVITIAAQGSVPDDEDDWEPVVCGPYERDHALALARAVVSDDDLMAVVEPMLPLDSPAAIRAAIEEARAPAGEDFPPRPAGQHPGPPPEPAEVRAGWRRIAAGILGM
ncbi:hypothetical protein [Actinoplanes couchii]|uniref:Uncharacterized protein n=1 Tax=Actinoplanes couchii TaxID=403638 RepID=A0ABQ3X9T2_9ACTN|nr:hypothetical protein [Actinoplanes couchii]MDR6325103.1 hypothetical protein [Actinoplanes couchii]GID55272.1 hypothetical protein Aco03nite_036760 [Actinoplanes couchii]